MRFLCLASSVITSHNLVDVYVFGCYRVFASHFC